MGFFIPLRDLVLSVPKPPFHSPEGAVMMGKLSIYSHGFDPSGGADFCYPGGYPIGKSCKWTTSAQEVRGLVLSVPIPPFHSPEGAVLMGKHSIYSHGFDPSGGAGDFATLEATSSVSRVSGPRRPRRSGTSF